MTTVATVRGPIDSADLGRTYMHEHIFVLTTEVQQNFPEEWGDEEARVADAVAKLGALAASGVRTIVDPTVIGLGRYIPRIQRVADQVPDLNIVVATGCYTYHDVPFFFHYRTPAVGALLGRDEPEPMVPLFVGRHHRGDRRDRRPGRHAQVRHRRGRAHPRGGADHAGRGPYAPRHRVPRSPCTPTRAPSGGSTCSG